MQSPPTKDMPPIFNGYTYTGWPDLSADRSPAHNHYLSATKVQQNSGEKIFPVILSAIARTLGTYCSASDILIAVHVGDGTDIGPVRIEWDHNKLWDDLIAEVGSSILEAINNRVSVSTISGPILMKDDQFPCMAICHLGMSSVPQNEHYPAAFAYHSSGSLLQLSTQTAKIHPTVASQIIEQVSCFIEHASLHPLSKVATTPSFPSKMMSVWERCKEAAVISPYLHFPHVEFAPDYLTLRAQNTPHATAVCWYPELSLDSSEFSFDSTTYSSLHRRSNQVARWLLRLGLQQEDRVAICLERNLHFHAAMMGIMRAGGCYVPIDPELPLERKTYIAKDAGAIFVLTSSKITSPAIFGSKSLFIEDDTVQLEISQEIEDDVEAMRPEGLAYLLYTSGTTGNPKGCLLTHKGLAQSILALSSMAAEGQTDNADDGRYLAVASIAFDVHLAETIVPIVLGIPLLSARRSQLLENLPIYVKKLRVTHIGIVPSLIEATLNASQDGVEGGDITLRYIASGGEKMSDSILDRWANHPQVRLANFYGPSEVTIGCCARYMTSTTPRSNVGKAFSNVGAYVVDSEMGILCRGGVGELVLEGPLVGRGYHGRPDLTEKVFIEWPRKGCWAYRTGDLVRMMPDGTIEIIGRIDTQIKLRGVRIESEGISAIVRKAGPSTNGFTLDVTTILAKHLALGADQLVAFFSWDKTTAVATRKSVTPTIAVPPVGLLKKIRAKCEAELAAYMRPSHFIPLSWLPLSSNGKTDAKSLQNFFQNLEIDILAQLSVADCDNDPTECTDTEARIFDLLQKHTVLPLESFRPRTNIFEIGLDSMAVIQFTADLRDTFNSKITASDVMKHPRINDIALLLGGPNTDMYGISIFSPFDIPDADLNEIHSIYGDDKIEDILPPFTVQEGVLARSVDMDTLYVQHVLISCGPAISLSKLENSWSSIIKMHQILRTVFHFGRSLYQIVLKESHCKLNWIENGEASVDRRTVCDNFLCEDAILISRDINQNLAILPPYRLSVYSTTDGIFLVLSIHHALFDGISLPLIFREVEKDYLRLDSNPHPVSPKSILKQITKIDFTEAKFFWEESFTGFQWPEPILTAGNKTSTQRFVMPFAASLSSIKMIAKTQQVTLQALFSCAYAEMLGRQLYRRKDVAFGILRSGRLLPIQGIDDALSPLVNIVPMRIDLNAATNILQNIQRSIASMVDYEHIPLSRVQGWVRPGRPLFETLFSVSVEANLKSDIWETLKSEPPKADYPLAVEIVLNPTNDSLMIQAAWTDVEYSQIIRECLRNFENTVYAISDDPVSYFADLRTSPQPIAKRKPDASTTEFTLKIDESSLDLILISKLRRIIAKFLDVNPTILTSSMSFISMGLDSIKSVGLARTLSSKGLAVTSTELLRNSTLASLATYMTHATPELPSIKYDNLFEHGVLEEMLLDELKFSEKDSVEVFPTTALQTGMLSQTVNSGGQLYLHTFPMQVLVEVDVDRLRNAWKTAVQSFAILRTSFHFLTESGLWIQAVHSLDNFNWSIISLKSSDDYKQALQDFAFGIKVDNPDAFKRPPFWIRLFITEDCEAKERTVNLAFILHHALYDGISIVKLLAAVESFYRYLPYEVPTQFHELLPHFIKQERDGTSFWVKTLLKYHPARLPYCYPLSSPKSVTLEKHVPLDQDRIKKLLCQAAVTPQCIGQAAWAKTLCKWTRRQDVLYGHIVSGRSVPGAENVIGPVLNTVPCCIRLETGTTNVDLLRHIHQTNLDTLPWQQASLRSIQKALRVDSLWDSLFLFQPSEEELNQAPLWRFDEKSIGEEVRIQYPLNIEMVYQRSGIQLKCASLSDVLGRDELAALLDDVQKFLTTIVNEPDCSAYDGLPKFVDDAEILALSDNTLLGCRPLSRLQEPISSHALTLYRPILALLTQAPSALLKLDTPLVALGIDSITSIQMVSKFRQAGFKLTSSDVINSRTVGEMLQKVVPLNDHLSCVKKRTYHEVKSEEKARILSLFGKDADYIETVSIASSGMKWIIGAWQRSRRTRYQHAFAYRLLENVDVSQMKQAWFSLVRSHPILRSTFACSSKDGEPSIVTFNNDIKPLWSEEYISEDVFFKSTLEKMKSLVSNPLPTSRPPTQAVFLGSTQHRCLIVHLHHFQYDAWSLQLLFHDLCSLYRGVASSISSDMHTFLSHYAPNKQHLAQQHAYWRASFPAAFKPQLFPAMNPTFGNLGVKTRLVRTNHACILNAQMCEERARVLGVSLQSVFLASWSRIHGEMSGMLSSTFGLWHSGRTGALDDIGNLAIPCMNVLPMYTSVGDRPTLKIAESIQHDLQQRTSVVEQSDLRRVAEWIGVVDEPICNVFINIVKVAPDVVVEHPLLEPVDVPYYIPAIVPDEGTTVGDLAITALIKDDLMIDIARVSKTNSILFSIDAEADFMDEKQADALISRWAGEVQMTLGFL